MSVLTENEREAYVAGRFDALADRFKDRVDEQDVRLRGIEAAIGGLVGARVLDLGCGKGRFGRHLARGGAEVVGLDASEGMLRGARGMRRVRGSAGRLPFCAGAFDVVMAVDVFQHLGDRGRVLEEVARVLRPGGLIAVVDKNAQALDARRPWLPSAGVKWLDERRGRWMYPAGGKVRERWLRPLGFARELLNRFEGVEVAYLLRPEEACWGVFRHVPRARLWALWTGRKGREAR